MVKLQLDISHHQVKPPVSEMDYIQLNWWPNGLHGNPQATKAVGCSLQTDVKVILLKITLPYLIVHEEVKLVHN